MLPSHLKMTRRPGHACGAPPLLYPPPLPYQKLANVMVEEVLVRRVNPRLELPQHAVKQLRRQPARRPSDEEPEVTGRNERLQQRRRTPTTVSEVAKSHEIRKKNQKQKKK